MKSFNFIFVAMIILGSSFQKTVSQDYETLNAINGGTMELTDASNWTVVDLNGGTSEYTTTFGYTDDKPTAGAGGCLQMSAQPDDGANISGLNYCIYQTVNLKQNVVYTISGKVKVPTTPINSWFEIYVSGQPVVEGLDYNQGGDWGAEYCDQYMSLVAWDTPCQTVVDGELTEVACDNYRNTVVFDKDTTVNFVIKAGIWSGPILNFLIDDIKLNYLSLISGINTETFNYKLSQNPVTNGHFTISSVENASISLFSIVGKKLFTLNNCSSETKIDVSKTNAGMYILLIEKDGCIKTEKIIIK